MTERPPDRPTEKSVGQVELENIEQLLFFERFLDEGGRPRAVVAERGEGITAHVDDDDARPLGDDGVGQFGSLHCRHDHVGEEQIDVARMALTQGDGAFAICASTTA